MHLDPHPAADIFPMMSGSDFAALKEDIRQNGQRERIVMFDDKVLDGRNRYRACEEIGVEPELCELEECKDPVAYVLSLNLHRRHLTDSQRAMIAAKVATMRQGQRTDIEPSANLPKVSQAQAAELLNVSPRSVTAAKRVATFCVPEVQQAVERGELAVSRAAAIADLDEGEQVEAMAAGYPHADRVEPTSLRHRLGIFKGNEAINALKTIGPKDHLRIRGFQVVADFIRSHCPEAMAISDMLAEEESPDVVAAREALLKLAAGRERLVDIPEQLAEELEFQIAALIESAILMSAAKRTKAIKRITVCSILGSHGDVPPGVQYRINQIIHLCCQAIQEAPAVEGGDA